jgi:hypothetical protein
MKAIKIVIGSYFVQPWPLGLIFWGSLVFYFFVTVITMTNVDFLYQEKNIPMIGYAVSIGLFTSFLGINLRRVIQSPTSLLLPKYRQTHILCAFISMIALMIFPVLWFTFIGFSPLLILTALLFISGAVMIITYRFSEQIVQIIILLWIVKIGMQMLGFNFGPRIWGLSDLELFGSQTLFEILFLIIVLTSFFLFYRYYLRVSIYKEYIARHTDDGWNRNHDTGSRWQMALVNYQRNRMISRNKNKKNSRFFQVRLFQYSLFSPFNLTLSTVFVYAFFIFAYGLTVVWQFYNFSKSGFDMINLMIHMTFVIFILILISDFMNHRNRISLLWMQSRSKEKKEFLDNIFWSVIYLSIKFYISVSVLYFLGLFMLSYSGAEVIASLLLGLNFYILIPALAFLFSNSIKSEGSNGWNMFMMFFVIFTITIGNGIISKAGDHLIAVIIFFLVTLVISTVLLYLSKIKWRDTELTLPGLP